MLLRNALDAECQCAKHNRVKTSARQSADFSDPPTSHSPLPFPIPIYRSSPSKTRSPAGKKDPVVEKVDTPKVDTPMSCAETPTGGKGKETSAEVAAEVAAVALALEKEDEEEAKALADDSVEIDDEGGDADWVEEERKLREENKKRDTENRKKNNKMGITEKVELLDNLLQKAAAYTAFLKQRMKVK